MFKFGPFWQKGKLTISVPFPILVISSFFWFSTLSRSQSLRRNDQQILFDEFLNKFKFCLTFASVLAAALTAVYSRRAKKTKNIHTPVHRSTAWSFGIEYLSIFFRIWLCIDCLWLPEVNKFECSAMLSLQHLQNSTDKSAHCGGKIFILLGIVFAFAD